MTAERGAVTRAGLAGAVVLAAFLGGIAPAAADPAPPVDPAVPLPLVPVPAPPPAGDVVPAPPAGGVVPAPPAPPAGPKAMLGQVTQALQSNPVAAMQDLLAASPQPPVLGQAPPPPGSPAPGPNADPLSSIALLRPQNYRMPTADQVSPYELAPNDNPSPFARIDAWKGVHALVHGGLGRMPGDELGQALPGTAPPPGTNLPPGLEQFYVNPAAAAGPPPPGTPAPVPPPADPLLPILLPG